jgi:gliding motility-associated-like protein
LSTNNVSAQLSDVAFVVSENPCQCPGCLVPIPPTNQSAVVCEGESFVFYGQDLSVGGTYIQTLNSFNGCDSTIVLTLVVQPAQQTSVAVSLCDGTNYQFGGQNLSQSGIYFDTLATWQGCDSVIVLSLDFIPEILTALNVSLCDGESYVFNGNTLSAAGLYVDTLPAFGGCDSIVSLNLQVWPNVQTTVNETICSTDSFLFNGVYLTQSGMYAATFQTINGCDSTVSLELSLFPYYTSQLAVVTCDGIPFVFNGVSYSQTGIYQIPYPDQNGCDSLVVLNLVVNPVIPSTIFTESLCEGESYDFYGQILTTSGSYTQTYTNLNGCDSTIVLQLTVYEHQDTSLSVLLCEGLSYDGYTEPGFYTDTLETFAGCDSIRMLQLSFQLPSDSMDVDLCDGEAFLGFTESGVYTDTIYGMDGCDTLRTFFVTANNLYVPNVFSPDDNGINDHFEIFLSEPTSIQITYFAMFDRWGNMVYEVKDNNVVKWDGNFRGKPVNPAVFSYVLLYRCNGFEKDRHGSVTVVR